MKHDTINDVSDMRMGVRMLEETHADVTHLVEAIAQSLDNLHADAEAAKGRDPNGPLMPHDKPENRAERIGHTFHQLDELCRAYDLLHDYVHIAQQRLVDTTVEQLGPRFTLMAINDRDAKVKHLTPNGESRFARVIRRVTGMGEEEAKGILKKAAEEALEGILAVLFKSMAKPVDKASLH